MAARSGAGTGRAIPPASCRLDAASVSCGRGGRRRGAAGSCSGMSTTVDSVVSTMPAIDAALDDRRLGHLDRVDDAGLDHVAVLAGVGVVALADRQVGDLC